MSKKQISFFITFTFILIFGRDASAYIPRTDELLTSMINKYGKAETLVVEQKQILFYNDESGNKKQIELKERLTYKFGGKFRSDIKTSETTETKIISSGKFLYLKNGEPLHTSETASDLYKDILLYRKTSELANRLTLLGINLNFVSLRRYNDKICYAIGIERPNSEDTSYILIDKNDLKPVRLVLGTVDIRYKEWKLFETTWYPTSIEIYRNSEIDKNITVLKVSVNPKIDPKLFHIDNASGSYKKNDLYKEEEDINEVRNIIKSFKRKFNL